MDDFERELFSEEELEVLNADLVRFRSSTARDLSDSSHDEDGYKKVDMKRLVPNVYANSLKALNWLVAQFRRSLPNSGVGGVSTP